jgi:hypothetical protein
MTKSVLAFSVIAMVSIPMAARASLLTGVLNVTGSVNISLGDISFQNGMFSITSPASTQQGDFMALQGTTGTIDDITNPPDATGIVLDETDFITLAGATNITFTLTFIFPGIDGASGCSDPVPMTGQLCTPDVPSQSPYNLQNTSGTTSTASFNILGTEVDSTTGDTIPITGTFSEPFTNMTFQELDADVEGGQTVTTPFSAQFQTQALPSAPEPSGLLELMMGIGLVGISAVYRKKLKRA